MLGCVARAVFRPGKGVLEGEGGGMVRRAMSRGELVGMHVRFGSMHTSNYQVSVYGF